MDEKVMVSINCITYNHGSYISKALDSFLMQKTNFKFEIIIGEDCSTDNTRSIVESYQKKYPDKIKLITSDKNVGARNNSRRVFNASQGKYIAACEGDDYWIDEYKLQKQFDYMEQNSECGLVFNNTKYLDDRTGEISIREVVEEKKYLVEDVIRNGGDFIPTASIMYRKEIMVEPPEFYIKASVGDYPLQILCATYGHVYCISDFMSVYRTNVQGSWTTNTQFKKITKEKLIDNELKLINILDMVNVHYNKNYDQVINETKIPMEFNVYLLKEKKITIKKIKETKFFNYYYNLSNKKKIIHLIKGNLTNFYVISKNIKNFIKYKIKVI